jgi:hypothetical protein
MGVLSPQFGSLLPSLTTQPLVSNYLNFNSGAGNDFAQQYLPEIYEAEVERYGNRTLAGFLRMVGAEMPMMSDQVVWSEQNRLHISYDQVSCTAVGANGGNRLTVPAGSVNTIFTNMTVVIMDPSNPSFTVKAIVVATGANGAGGAGGVQNFDVIPYTRAAVNAGVAIGATLKVFVYGSEFGKGSVGPATGVTGQSIQPQLTTFSNKPIIIRDRYAVSGSDTAQIGWVEVAGEDGTSGYLWYLKAESETRLRFEDYLEMAMVESELSVGGPAALTAQGLGTQGLFAAIQARGNVEVGFTAAAGLDAFDAILKNLDTQGAIEENMLFLNRSTALDFDDMLASISGGFSGGTAFGLFENSEEMALNLGFSGFRRGSYDFYKTDWKYLNDASTRGAQVGPASIEGVLVPAGTTTVYDQILGTNIRRPFLHVRYRASQADDRRMKSWLTGSAGGAFTSTLDAMEVNFLSERCLVTQAANNFVLFKGL